MYVCVGGNLMKKYIVDENGNIQTCLKGNEVISNSFLNKGVAFTKTEREDLGLEGLLPPAFLTIDEQVDRVYKLFHECATDLDKNLYLTALSERNKVLYYKVITKYLSEMLPIIYTPTVGLSIQRYSSEYRRPSGVYLSIDNPSGIEQAFLNYGMYADDVDLIVVTDGEGILGIGDWGVGGINISIGKLALYTAAAGINPNRVIPVVLDTGTNRESLLNDPLYVGNRHARVSGNQYDEFIDKFVNVVSNLFPNSLLHWEDFGSINAHAILEKYRDKVCTFNDDIQGTGAVSLAAVLAAVRATDLPLTEHRIVVFGSGTAGIGIADQVRDAMIRDGLSEELANARFWCIDRDGLLFEDMNLCSFQKTYARKRSEFENMNSFQLKDVVDIIKPTILIGTSTVKGAFTEEIIRNFAKYVERPIILPMSNPTNLAEATPEDLINWTDGRALVATGSPFNPVKYKKSVYVIGQSNNALVFPGIGLGVVISQASIITDGMFVAAAEVLSKMIDTSVQGAPILPPVENLKEISIEVAIAVAEAAIEDGVARKIPEDIKRAVMSEMWEPTYPIISKI